MIDNGGWLAQYGANTLAHYGANTREKRMNRILVAAGLLLLGSACAGGTPDEVARIEADEDMEETVGDERMMMGSEGRGVDGMMDPNAMEDVEMANEEYPE